MKQKNKKKFLVKILPVLIIVLVGIFLKVGFANAQFSMDPRDWMISLLKICRDATLGFVSFSMWFLDVMLSKSVYDEVFFSSQSIGAINVGWGLVRDFVNMFYILILIFLAIATILGISQYNDKKKLVYVLASALLVNFSKPIALLIIDMSQLMMNFFMDNISASQSTFSTAFANAAGMQNALTGSFSAHGEIAIMLISQTIFFFIFGMMIMFLAISLVVRLVAFWVLIVLSPLAFFAIALPGTRIGSLKSAWFSKMFSWAFYGPVLLFFMWLALVLVHALTASVANSPTVQVSITSMSSTNSSTGASFIKGALKAILPFVSAIYFLYYGLDSAKSVASAAGGAATAVLGKAGRMVSGSGIKQMARKASNYTRKGVNVVGNATGLNTYGEAFSENVKDKLNKGKYTKMLTAKGRKDITEERKAKYKAGAGIITKFTMPFKDSDALNDLYAKQSMEVSKDIKEGKIQLTSDKMLEDMRSEKTDIPKKIAYARELAKNGKLNGDDLKTAMDFLKNRGSFKDEVLTNVGKKNKGAVFDYLSKDETLQKNKISEINGKKKEGQSFKDYLIEQEVEKRKAEALRNGEEFSKEEEESLVSNLRSSNESKSEEDLARERILREKIEKMSLSDITSSAGKDMYDGGFKQAVLMERLKAIKKGVGHNEMRKRTGDIDPEALRTWKDAGLLDNDNSADKNPKPDSDKDNPPADDKNPNNDEGDNKPDPNRPNPDSEKVKKRQGESDQDYAKRNERIDRLKTYFEKEEGETWEAYHNRLEKASARNDADLESTEAWINRVSGENPNWKRRTGA